MSADPERGCPRSRSVSSLTLVVPVFNEQVRIPEYAPALVAFVRGLAPGSELLFVDDGSSDASPRLVEEVIERHPDCRVRLLRRPHEGKGAAVSAGLAAAHADLAGFCDLDLATPLEDFERVIGAASRADVLATGSRALSTSTLIRRESRARELLGQAYNRLVQATVAPGVVDTQCGAKVARRAVWSRILPWCREPGFAWDAEAIAVALALGIPVQEVPIAWRHDDRTKVRVLRDGVGMVLATGRILRTAARARAEARRAFAQSPGGVGALIAPSLAREHWRFRSEAALVATALGRTARVRPRGLLVAVGGSSGVVASRLGWDPGRVVVVEGDARVVGDAHRAWGLEGVRGSRSRLPIADARVDVLCLLDVIEHLAEPRAALGEAWRVLAPGGRLVVGVPARRWPWNEAGAAPGPVRRYDRAGLGRELSACGFAPRILTHVFGWLVPLPTRAARPRSGPTPALDDSSALVDTVAAALTLLERTLLGRVSLPLGTSLLCVAEKTTLPASDG